jgi:hypothetical protein
MTWEVEERERRMWHSFYEVTHFGYSTMGRCARPEGAESEVVIVETFVQRRGGDNGVGGRRKGEAHVAFLL